MGPFEVGQKLAIVSMTLKRAVDSTIVTSIEALRGNAHVAFKLHTLDDGVWFVLREGYETSTPFGAGVILPVDPHPKWYLHFYVVPFDDQVHVEEIRRLFWSRVLRSTINESYEHTHHLSADKMESLNKMIRTFLSDNVSSDKRG